MERLIRIDQQIINKYKPDGFALPQVLKHAGVSREYKINGGWTVDKPNARPEATRIIFDSRDQLRIARDVYFAWKTLSDMKIYNPVQPEEIIKRIFDNRSSPIAEIYPGRDYDRPPLCLFIPWGVRPQGKFGYPEKAVLDRIKLLQTTLWQRNVNVQALIMPADLYATEVNQQVDNDQVAKYFEDVTNWAYLRGFFVKPWSAIRQENIGIYQQRSTELTQEKLAQMFKPAKIDDAISAAGRRSGYKTRSDIQQAAFAYLRERVCEAEITESVYKPIKVSAVAKNKDNDVDRDLPRVYIIPEELQFPWLK